MLAISADVLHWCQRCFNEFIIFLILFPFSIACHSPSRYYLSVWRTLHCIMCLHYRHIFLHYISYIFFSPLFLFPLSHSVCFYAQQFLLVSLILMSFRLALTILLTSIFHYISLCFICDCFPFSVFYVRFLINLTAPTACIALSQTCLCRLRFGLTWRICNS